MRDIKFNRICFLVMFMFALITMPLMQVSAKDTINQDELLTVYTGDTAVVRGQEFTVPIMLDNNPDMYAINISAFYDDDNIELIGFENGVIFEEVTTNLDIIKNKQEDDLPFKYIGSVAGRPSNIDTNGKLFSLTFKVKEDTDLSNTQIQINVVQVIDASNNDPLNWDYDPQSNEEPVHPVVKNGTIKILKDAIKLSATFNSDVTKVYDNSSEFNITDIALTGIDTEFAPNVKAEIKGSTTDANVGLDKEFTATEVILTGADSNLYVLPCENVSGVADITPKAITGVTVAENTHKEFNGEKDFSDVVLVIPTEEIITGDNLSAVANGKSASKDVGTYTFSAETVTLSGDDKDNYSLAPEQVTGNVTIDKKLLTLDMINVDSSNCVYTSNPVTADLTIADGDIMGSSDYKIEYVNNVKANDSTTKVIVTPQGNYSGSAHHIAFNIAKANPQITISAQKNEPNLFMSMLNAIGLGDHEDTFTVTTTVAGVTDNEPHGKFTVTDNGEELSTYDIAEISKSFIWENPTAIEHTLVATFTPSNPNYKEVSADVVYDIAKADQEIVIEDVKDKTYGDEAFNLVIKEDESHGSGAVTYISSNKNVATIDENGLVTIVGIGDVTINARKDSSDNYNSCEDSVSFSVAKKEITAKLKDGKQTTKIYDGNVNFTNLELVIDSAVYDDELTAFADGTVTSANVGGYAFTATALRFTGDNVDCYDFTTSDITGDVTIEAKEITDAMVKITENTNLVYTGDAFTPSVVLTDSTILTIDDYKVEYSNNINAGKDTACIKITAQNNYKSVLDYTFSIAKAIPTVDIVAEKVEPSLIQQFTNALGFGNYEDEYVIKVTVKGVKDEKPEGKVTIKNGEEVIAQDIELSNGLASFDWKEVTPDTYKLKAYYTSENNNYENNSSEEKEYSIEKANQEIAITQVENIIYGDDDFTLEVTGQKGDGELTFTSEDESVLSVNRDGTVTINAYGETKIKVSKASCENYNEDTAEITISVAKRKLTASLKDGEQLTKIYDGNDKFKSMELDLTNVVGDDDITITADVTTVENQVNVGAYDIVATNLAYSGEKSDNYILDLKDVSGEVTIERKVITTEMVSLSGHENLVYNGEEQNASVYVMDKDVAELTKDTDYTVTYLNTKNQGTASVIIRGVGNYKDGDEKVTLTYDIAKKPLSADMIADIQDFVYTGEDITPSLNVTDVAVITTDDYTVSYKDNIQASELAVAIITATDSGNYSGTASKNFVIKKADSQFTELAISDDDVIYGEVFDVTFTPNILVTDNIIQNFFNMFVSNNQAGETAGLYLGDVLLASAENVKENTAVVFTVKTTDKKISADLFNGKEHKLTVKWGGDNNLKPQQADILVTLSKKDITANVDEEQFKEYDDNADWTDLSATIVGLEEDDDVSITVDGTTVTADVEDEKVLTITSITVTGDEKDYYNLPIENVTSTVVEIKQSELFTSTLQKIKDDLNDSVNVDTFAEEEKEKIESILLDVVKELDEATNITAMKDVLEKALEDLAVVKTPIIVSDEKDLIKTDEESIEKLKDILFTEEEINGADSLKFNIESEFIELNETDKALVQSEIQLFNEKNASNYVAMHIGQAYDVNLIKSVGSEKTKITSPIEEEITITFDIPKEIINQNYQYYIIRVHDGKTTLLKDLDKNLNTITVKSERFSTYTIVYTKDVVRLPETGDTFPITIVLGCMLVSLVGIYMLRKSKNNKKGED